MNQSMLVGMIASVLSVMTLALPSSLADDQGPASSETQASEADNLSGILVDTNIVEVSSETPYFSFSPGNSRIIFCGVKGVTSMDPGNGETKMLLESPQPGQYVWAWMSPSEKQLLVLKKDITLVLVNLDSGKQLPVKDKLPKGFKKCAFSPDGTHFVAIGGMQDSELLYWTLTPSGGIGTRGQSSLADCNTLYDGAFSQDGKLFATVSGSGLVDFWSAPPMSPTKRGTSVTRNGGLSGIAVSADGKWIAAATAFQPSIVLIESATGDVAKRIDWSKPHPLFRRKLAFLAGKNTLATSDGDKIGFLDLDTGERLGSVSAGGGVMTLGCSPDGKTLVAGTRDRRVIRWRLKP